MNSSSSGADPLDELAHEFAERLRRGEQPSVEEYAARHPHLAEGIRELFPALAVMEEFGSAPKPTDPHVPGRPAGVPEQLGEYRVVREIARGGMGVVYEAEQVALGRRVALKVLPGHPIISSHALERFRREARAAANLHHTNIVPVYGVGEDQGVHYYAMQYIRGQTLASVLDELRRLPQGGAAAAPTLTGEVARSLLAGELTRTAPAGPAELPVAHPPTDNSGSAALSRVESQYYRSVARVGLQVAEALAHAHDQGVLHRDIKPGNLLIDTQGVVWVTDFGLAKAEGTDDLTNPGDILGTLRYMAPERFDGKSDARSDVYALGLTLYEMATLRPAFAGISRADLIDKVRREDPAPPRRLAPHVPRDLETIILKASTKEPDRRYQSAAAMAEDLRLFLADRTIQARRATVLERGWRWARRNPTVATLTATVAILLAAGLPLVTVLWLRAAREAELAENRRREAEENLTLARTAVDDSFTAVSEDVLLKSPLPGLQPLRRQLLQASLKYYQEFARRNANDPARRAELAAAYLRLGEITAEVGSQDEAIGHLHHAADLFVELSRAEPADWTHPAERGRCLALRGNLRVRQGDVTGALADFDESIAVLEPITREHPSDARPREVLAYAHHYLSTELSAQLIARGRAGDPEKHAARAIELRQGLADQFPNDLGHHVKLSSSLNNFGFVLYRSGRAEDALANVRKANDLQRKLVERNPHQVDLRYHLAMSTRGLGQMLRDSEKWDQALPYFRESNSILARLVAENPAVTLYRLRLAGFRSVFGQELVDHGDLGAAREQYDLAREDAELVEKADPKSSLNLNSLAAIHRGFGKILAKQGKPAEGLASLKKAVTYGEQIAGKDSFYTYDLSCSLALCAEFAALVPDGTAESRTYADRAMKTLGQAVAEGWTNATLISQDPDLTSLRGRPDFQALLASLKQPEKK